MLKSSLIALFSLFLLRGGISAQNIYESIGKTTEVLTLSNGKYQEFFPNDTLVRIGNVLFNTITNEVVEFFSIADTVVAADVASRFLSVDPLMREYPELTPYQFASNTPIQGIDLDGLEIIYHWQQQKEKYAGFAKVLQLAYDTQMFGKLEAEFKKDNKGVDIYIVANSYMYQDRGETMHFKYADYKDEKGNVNPTNMTNAIDNKVNSISKRDEPWAESSKDTKDFLNYIATKSISKGNDVVIITINLDNLAKILSSNVQTAEDNLKFCTFTLIHEIEFHGLDFKDRKDNKHASVEHQENYNLPKPSSSSPDYDKIDPQSRAGAIKKTIEETINKQKATNNNNSTNAGQN